MDIFSIFSSMKVCYMHSLDSPHLQLWDFFHGTQERVRNSRGKRAISVRVTEDLSTILHSVTRLS